MCVFIVCILCAYDMHVGMSAFLFDMHFNYLCVCIVHLKCVCEGERKIKDLQLPFITVFIDNNEHEANNV